MYGIIQFYIIHLDGSIKNHNTMTIKDELETRNMTLGYVLNLDDVDTSMNQQKSNS